MKNRKTQNKIYTLTSLAILTALTVVLQLLPNWIAAAAQVPFTLSLVPVVIGALVFGAPAGAFLGGVLGIVNLISTFANPFLLFLFQEAPVAYVVVCVGKTLAAGLVAGLLYRALAKGQKEFLGVCFASLSAPIVNTGIFLVMMALFFRDALTKAAVQFGMVENAAQVGNIWTFVMMFIITVNFFIEFGVNAVLSVAIDRIVRAVRRRR